VRVRLIALTLTALLVVLTTSEGAYAHGSTRNIGYNTAYNTHDSYCNYTVQHGNVFSTPYAKILYYNNNPFCTGAGVTTTYCLGLACGDASPAFVYTPNQWAQSTGPTGYNLAYSHSTVYYDCFPCPIVWHNTWS
jgi:hypothetical protein